MMDRLYRKIRRIWQEWLQDRVMTALARQAAPAEPHSLTIWQIAHLGDFLLVLPAMRKLAEQIHRQQGRVTLVCAANLREIARQCGVFDAVLSLETGRWLRATLAERRALAAPLLQHASAIAVNLVPVGPMAAWIRWTRADVRFSRLWVDPDSWRERRRQSRWRGVELLPEPPENRDHVLLRNLRLAHRVLGLPEPRPEDGSLPDPLDWLGDRNMEVVPEALLIFPGAGDRRREWPVERFAELAAWLHRQRPAWRILWCGSGAERDLCQQGVQILQEQQIPSANYGGQWNLNQVVTGIRNARMVIGNESAPMHIAGALQVPSLSLSPGVTVGEFLPCPAYTAQTVVSIEASCFGCRGVCSRKTGPAAVFPCLEELSVPQAIVAASRLLERIPAPF